MVTDHPQGARPRLAYTAPRLSPEEGARCVQLVLDFVRGHGLPEHIGDGMVRVVEQDTATEVNWRSFRQVSDYWDTAVTLYLARLKGGRAKLGLVVYPLLRNNIHWNSSRVRLGRAALAELAGTSPNNVSTVIKEMAKANIVRRDGQAYVLNPHVAWFGDAGMAAIRDREVAAFGGPPLLTPRGDLVRDPVPAVSGVPGVRLVVSSDDDRARSAEAGTAPARLRSDDRA